MSLAAESLHADLQSLIGQVIAERYRIDGLIGIGGMGAVFRGHHLGLKRDVAIKVLHPELTKDPQLTARFDREAHSASRLDHPNCLQVTDYGTTAAGMRFMVMQLLQGKELSSILFEQLAPARAVELILQIIRGLEHAHDQGVIHRDLKPENVFMCEDHEGRELLKLVDFGIAKIVSGDGSTDSMTRVGLIFGTPQYMSPEQATGMNVDARADLYSAGVILYQMLAGQPPFSAPDPVSLLRMQVTATPPPLPDHVPLEVRAIVEKLLQKDRDQRFADAASVRDALERVATKLDTLFREPPRPTSASAPPLASTVSPSMATTAVSPPLASTVSPSMAPTAVHEISTIPPRTRALVNSEKEHTRKVMLVLGGAAALFTVFLGVALWTGEKPSETSPALVTPPTAADDSLFDWAKTRPPRASAEQVAEIDRLMLANDIESAEQLLRPLRDQFPEDPQLLWRQGRLQAKHRRKQGQALTSYGEALSHEPKLVEDREFYAELWALLHDARVEQREALDVALRRMGPHGYKFMIELVNSEKKPLEYQDRHRVLDELAKDGASHALVNQKLNHALDLWQANQSLTPCASFRAALDHISENPDPYYVKQLEKAPLPSPRIGEGATTEDAKACEGIAEQRDAILAAHRTQFATVTTGEPSESVGDGASASESAAAHGGNEPEAEAKASNSKKKSTTAPAEPKKSNRCRKFGAALLYKECR